LQSINPWSSERRTPQIGAFVDSGLLEIGSGQLHRYCVLRMESSQIKEILPVDVKTRIVLPTVNFWSVVLKVAIVTMGLMIPTKMDIVQTIALRVAVLSSTVGQSVFERANILPYNCMLVR
jgi:hypothetical protein